MEGRNGREAEAMGMTEAGRSYVVTVAEWRNLFRSMVAAKMRWRSIPFVRPVEMIDSGQWRVLFEQAREEETLAGGLTG